MSTHTAIATTALKVVKAIQVPTSDPKGDEILIKVEYAAFIAFDTYQSDQGFYVQDYPQTLGINAAGTVSKVGDEISDLKAGDRVVAFTYGASPQKGAQEYALVSRTATAKVPDNVSLTSAVTIPDNFVTAYWTLTSSIGFSLPHVFPATTPPAESDAPILIYGSGATVGQYLIQLLALSGYKNVITTASKKHHDYLRSLGATHTFDYNAPDLQTLITEAASGNVKYAVDCITAEGSLAQIAKVVGKGSRVAYLLPVKQGNKVTGAADAEMFSEIPAANNPFAEGVETVVTRTFEYQQNETLRQKLMPEILPGLLASGDLKPNRVRLFDTGSFEERVKAGLDVLRNNQVSGEKVVVKVP
ncbi:hypothetical protein BOTBODRAFT_138161 [Botryobasidium botryosum FD-172 SS1]|uniref:Enoyl reductase (ER) domain-containing protein n=1 Tax=Botryobasidium botryosum (strain FD-172 SS1) TaxID=930990 RepID=A0A067MC13_BOTB1|nr:hypothetical protein BOTBODRAFT_138161 [Botryobasidium botryosum FD-172 SS1]